MSIFFPEDEGREVPNVDNQPILRTEIIAGAAGPTGSQGAKGDTGATGAGVVTGGLTGQVLAKKTNADYDTEWVTGGGGGAAIWGGIAGTLSNQTDLQTALDAKAPSSGISPSLSRDSRSDHWSIFGLDWFGVERSNATFSCILGSNHRHAVESDRFARCA